MIPTRTHRSHTWNVKGWDGVALLCIRSSVLWHVPVLNFNLPVSHLGLHTVGSLEQLLALSRNRHQVKEQMSSLVLVRLAWKQPGGGKQTFQPHFKGNQWSVVGKSWHFKHFNSSNITAVPLWWWADWPSAGGFWDQSGWWPWRAGRLPETWTWRGWHSWSRPPSPRIRGCRP